MNQEKLQEFTKFCTEHPELRFWQALSVWSGRDIVLIEPDGETIDTFHML